MSPLSPWMSRLLWFVGGYNLLAGVGMIVFYHEGFKLLGLAKPELMLPLQLVGVLVGIFGLGYWIVAANPVENRNVLLLGFLSKGVGSLFGLGYIIIGKMPLAFLPILFLADIVYLAPFWIILRRLYRAARQRAQDSRGFASVESPRDQASRAA